MSALNLIINDDKPAIITLDDMQIGEIAVILDQDTDSYYQGQLIRKDAGLKATGVFKLIGYTDGAWTRLPNLSVRILGTEIGVKDNG